MKRTSLSYFIVMLSFGSTVYGQTIDSALAYFPLHNGDQWEYSYRWAILSSYTLYTITVDGDTLMTNGKTYKKLSRRDLPNGSNRYTFVRIDSVKGNLYTYDTTSTGSESLSDSLRLGVGGFSLRYGMLARVDTVSFLGFTAMTRYYGGIVGGNGYWFAYDVGLIRAYEVGPMEYPYITTLVYARIDGQVFGTFLGVNETSSGLPEDFELMQNYPNPFNPSTTIRFSVPVRSRVRLAIFNLLGQQIAELANGEMGAGSHERTWNPNVASGMYFYRIEAVSVTDPSKRFVDVKKMLLMK